ncbi:DUF2892 domain-containing protein [Ktedonosporobacter rubrisoli]|uniref:DUF2892 domain-containing protein n=1 Tax=Ktedonosporobacter rubrisoli TaxID=2509675 RepID=A0A4P6JPV4_KTERU|nr:DUF2892 domain-containing protein [Ktedonosporobacter rubrisoli]QBD77263.1 DUF2892 domain-containing protein [Ktedonosporobacter rubrisoli]
MVYVKNVPTFERIVRVLVGSGLAVCAGWVYLQLMHGAWAVLLALVLLVSALFVAATGFFGWCPACALVGRKLMSSQRPS